MERLAAFATGNLVNQEAGSSQLTRLLKVDNECLVFDLQFQPVLLATEAHTQPLLAVL